MVGWEERPLGGRVGTVGEETNGNESDLGELEQKETAKDKMHPG